jgi:hypothetical protein
MSAPAWTPGPWRVHVEPASGYAVSSDSVFVCGSGEWPESQIARANVQDGFGEREANARLIAAAPDLAEALRYIAKTWPDSFAARTALTALAKAHGQ